MDNVAARGVSALEDKTRIPNYINKPCGKNHVRGNSVSSIFLHWRGNIHLWLEEVQTVQNSFYLLLN